MVAAAPGGRVFGAERRVRLGDAGPDGAARLDALARYLQDVASDDTRDAGFEAPGGVWVVRRTVLHVVRRPQLESVVRLETFVGGLGPRWAERRTTLSLVPAPAAGDSGHAGARREIVAEAAALWVYVDRVSAFPKPVPGGFENVWGDARGRRVSGRLSHGEPPAGARRRPWVLRSSDFDTLGHVNNAAYWEVVEDEMARRGGTGAGGRYAVEHRLPIEPGDEVDVLVDPAGGPVFGIWIVGRRGVYASARIQAVAGPLS